MKVRCECGAVYRAKSSPSPRRFACKKCGARIDVPASLPETPTEQTPAESIQQSNEPARPETLQSSEAEWLEFPDDPPDEPVERQPIHWSLRALAGGFVGATLGAACRAAVVALFLYYVTTVDTKFFSNHPGAGQPAAQQPLDSKLGAVVAISAAIGFVVGGLGGLTCRPVLGALISGTLSAIPCFCLIVFPANLMMSISAGGGGYDNFQVDRRATIVGLVAMMLSGVVAGAGGGGVGRWLGRVGTKIDDVA